MNYKRNFVGIDAMKKYIAVSITQALNEVDKKGVIPSSSQKMGFAQEAWPFSDDNIAKIAKALENTKDDPIIVLAYRTIQQTGYSIEECRKIDEAYYLKHIANVAPDKPGGHKRLAFVLVPVEPELANQYKGEYILILPNEPNHPQLIGNW